MNKEPEIIDSNQMKVLSNFPIEYENDEEITKPESAEKAELSICSLDKNIIIAYRSKKSGRLISEIIFDKQNILLVAKNVDKLLSEEKPWDKPIEFENGKDKLLITYSSSWAHNLPAPFERINIYNRRNYELDNLQSRDIWLSLPPEMAQRFADEITKLFK